MTYSGQVTVKTHRKLKLLKDEFEIIDDCDIDKTNGDRIEIGVTRKTAEDHGYSDEHQAVNEIADWVNVNKNTQGQPCTHDVYDDCIDTEAYEDVAGFGMGVAGFSASADLNDNDQVYICRDCEVIIKRM